ncbi:MAG: AsmA family protein [Elusimicrobia bacterium]|nr:AsmA family protein [Elusimicrobiota bacterium]
MRRPLKFLLRSVKFLFRVVGLLAILLVLAAGAAAFILSRMLTPEGTKAIVVSELQNVLHRPVEVQSVHVLFYEGIRIRGLRVLEAPGFKGPDFIASDVLVAKYKWRALLEKRLELSELRLVSPRIQIIRREDGKWNVEDIFVSSSTQHAQAKAGRFKLPFSLAADVITVDHGEVSVMDDLRDHNYRFKGVDLKVVEFDQAKPFVIDGKFENTIQGRGGEVHDKFMVKGAVSLAGFKWEDSYFSAEKIRGSLEGKSLTASGNLKDFKRPSIELSAKLPDLDSEYLKKFWPKLPEGLLIPAAQWKARLTLPATGHLLVDHVEASAPPLRAQGRGSLVIDEDDRRWKLTATVPPTPLADLARLWSGFGKHDLSGTGSGTVSFSGVFGEHPTPVRLESTSFSATSLGGVFFKPNHRLSRVDLSVSAKDNLDDVSFTVTRGTAVVYGSSFSDLSLTLKLMKGDVTLERLGLTWDASKLTLCGRLKNLSAPKEVRLDASVDRLRLDQAIAEGTRIVQQIKPPDSKPRTGQWSQIFKYSIPKTFPATAGRLRVENVLAPDFTTHSFRGLWNLEGISTGLSQVSGNVKVSFGPGRVLDIPKLEESSKLLKVLFLPFVFMHRLNNLAVISAATAYPKSFDFTTISGEYGLKAGFVDFRKFHLDSGVLKAFAEGTVDFPKEKVELHVQTKLSDARGALPEYLTGEDGRPAIGFFVENDLNKPDVRIDLHKQSSRAIEDAAEAAEKRSQPVLRNLEGGGLCVAR